MQKIVPWIDNSHDPLAVRYRNLTRTSLAMWTVLKSKLDIADDDLIHEIQAAEANLPVIKSQSLLTECGVCRRPMQITARCCLYCGTVPRYRS
jgi:hypothetical protein